MEQLYDVDYVEMLKTKIEVLQLEKQNIQAKELSLKIMIESLLEELETLANKEETTYYNREDIKKIFGCKDDKAKNILKLAQQLNLATTIGNHTVITRKNLLIFIDEWYKGQKVNITY